MKIDYPSIPDQTAEAIVSEWLAVIKRKECGVIMFPPKGDAHRRIEHLLSWKRILRKHLGQHARQRKLISASMLPYAHADITLLLHDLLLLTGIRTERPVQTPSDFLTALHPTITHALSVSFLLYDTDVWFREGRTDILVRLSEIAEKEPRIQFLLFCETDITAPTHMKQNFGRTTLVQNVIAVPLYDFESLRYLLDQFALYWNTRLPPDIRTALLQTIGPHTWLLKEGVRLYIKTGSLSASYVHEPTMRLRLETIWQTFTAIEQAVLQKITLLSRTFTVHEKNSLEYLKRIGLLRDEHTGITHTIPIFSQYISEKQYEKTITDENGELYCDDRSISSVFGPKERAIIKALLKSQGAIVPRENLASAVWPNGEYTDWSLDRIVSRVRAKFMHIGVHPEKIKTVKKEGFLWKE